MRKEFIVHRQGRAFVLYAGLLAEAHSQGLQSIRTELLQVPSEENGGIAICRAVVTMAHEQREQVYTGIGDAAVTNVAPAMVHCLLRMAETRAKARALRDAVNVGVSAFEELSPEQAGDDDDPAVPCRTSESRSASRPRRATSPAGELCPECYAPVGMPHTSKCSQYAPSQARKTNPAA